MANELTTLFFEDLDRRINELKPDTVHRKLLEAVRDSRNCWLRTAFYLEQMIVGGDYQELGYATAEEFALKECNIKKAIVNKMLKALRYTREHHPELLDGTTETSIPDLDTVAALEASKASKEQAREVDARIYAGELTGAEARAAVKALSETEKTETEDAKNRRALISAAKKFRAAAETCTEIDDELAGRAMAAANEVLQALPY